MVTLNKIYTRTGDGGQTRLASGAPVSKTDARVEAYGAVDELNAVIGIARLNSGQNDRIDAMLGRIQNELFDLGADLATPLDPPPAWEALRIIDSQVERLEQEIDWMNESLKALDSFILPGGAPLSAHLHMARTVCRRAEREAVRLVEAGGGGQRRGRAVSEPAVGPSVRRRPPRQRQWRRRRQMETGRDPLGAVLRLPVVRPPKPPSGAGPRRRGRGFRRPTHVRCGPVRGFSRPTPPRATRQWGDR